MRKFFEKVKQKVKSWGFDDDNAEEAEDEYLELDTAAKKTMSQKVIVRPFVLNDFTDVKAIVDAMREGSTIALVNIKPLKDKDLVELKRAVNKLKKTCDALSGDVAGFGDDYIVVTPQFAEIYRSKDNETVEIKEE
ncbi:MAG: cell division protein SepF [Nanoarchaeota archaeon]|nr:cell division protein SepF [Nanoarchaeota archaeon]